MEHNMQKLQELAAKNGPLCVGLDTDPSYIPPSILKCCCKVQIAYYEAMGIEGMKAYSQTLRLVKDAGLVCISDIKRGDIANTAGAYAKAHFSGDFETDIITVNPYMGFETLNPFTEYCASQGKGIFVLLRTSNPGMADIEWQELKSGGRVMDKTGSELNRLAAQFAAQYTGQRCSPVGAVVGCTEEADARNIRDAYPDIFFLIPGYGAQGGAARIAATLLAKAGGTVNSSRGILCAWKKSSTCRQKEQDGTLTMDDLGDAAGAAAIAAKQELTAAVQELG